MTNVNRPRIGILTGTFDPVHQGHLDFCLGAAKTCQLDKVFLAPEACPRRKQHVSDISQRFKWLEQALANLPGGPHPLEAAKLNSGTFNVRQTMPELRRLCGKAKIFLLLGSDVAPSLSRWEDMQTLLNEVSFVIALRYEDKSQTVDDIMRQLGKTHQTVVRYKVIPSPHPTLSSSQLRPVGGYTGAEAGSSPLHSF